MKRKKISARQILEMDLFEVQQYLEIADNILNWSLIAILCMDGVGNDPITVGRVLSLSPASFTDKYTSILQVLSVDVVGPLKKMFQDQFFMKMGIVPDHWK